MDAIAASGSMTRDHLEESLFLWRRQVVKELAVAAVTGTLVLRDAKSPDDIAKFAEDMGHALYTRMAARETGKVTGYV